MAASTATNPTAVASVRALPLPIIRSPVKISNMPAAHRPDQRLLLESATLLPPSFSAIAGPPGREWPKTAPRR